MEGIKETNDLKKEKKENQFKLEEKIWNQRRKNQNKYKWGHVQLIYANSGNQRRHNDHHETWT